MAKVAYTTSKDETDVTKGARRGAPGENISPKSPGKANLRGSNRRDGKAGGAVGGRKANDKTSGNPFKSALNAGKK